MTKEVASGRSSWEREEKATPLGNTFKCNQERRRKIRKTILENIDNLLVALEPHEGAHEPFPERLLQPGSPLESASQHRNPGRDFGRRAAGEEWLGALHEVLGALRRSQGRKSHVKKLGGKPGSKRC